MAILIADYRDSTLPKIEEGAPFLRAWRHYLQYQPTADLVVGDDLIIRGAVPATEFWKVRHLATWDFTGGGVYGAQSWERLSFGVRQARAFSPAAVAVAGIGKPSGPWTTSAAVYWLEAWQYGWDGVTPVAWVDANEIQLIVRDTDPTFSPSVLVPGQHWEIKSEGAKVAGGGVARAFTVVMLVDRIRVPRSVAELAQRDGRDAFADAIHFGTFDGILGG